jgi:hypothetical protein
MTIGNEPPLSKPLTGQIAVVTGAAGGPGADPEPAGQVLRGWRPTPGGSGQARSLEGW